MAYVSSQKKEQQTTPATSPDDKLAEPRKRPTGDKDNVPQENKNLRGKDDPKAAEDEKRAAEVTAKWEGLLGKWLGGKLAPLVLQHVSLDALNGYIDQGLKEAGPALGAALKKETSPDAKQAAALKQFSDALSGVVTGQVDKWIKSETGQKVLKAISEWVQDNPGWVMTIIGSAVIGGAVAAWFANPDLPTLEASFGLGKGWQTKVGLDLGTVQSLGFQGASLVVANKNQKITIGAEVTKTTDDKDGELKSTTHAGTVSVKQGDKGKENLTFVLNGSVTDHDSGLVAHTADGTLKLVDADNGVTVTVGADGKWDSKGNKEQSVKYTMATGKGSPVSGNLEFAAKSVTIVDKDGNIVTTNAQSLKVAVGAKAGNFSASVKQETDADGKDKTIVGVSGKGQLGTGALFKGDANVEIGEGETKVKLNGQMTAKIGGKDVTFDGAYATDGPITGKIKVGSGGKFREIKGTKKGDVVTFTTTEVFGGHSIQRESSKDGEGNVTNQTTVNAAVAPGHKVSISGGDKGNKLSYEGHKIGGTGLNIKGHVGDKGFGVGASYEEGFLKAHLDYTMSQGTGSLKVGAAVNTASGLKLETDINLSDSRLQELGAKLGYRDPKQFRTFLVGYKAKWMADNKQYAHHFDALLEYSLGNWSARLDAGVDLRGNKLTKTKVDLGVGYALDNNWSVIGGMQYGNALNTQTNAFDHSFKPYVGLQYGKIGVAGFYDSKSKGGGLMLTIPLGKR